jgi:hypothetical protein
MPTIASTAHLPKPATASTAGLKEKTTPSLDSHVTVITLALDKVLTSWPELLRGAIERAAADQTVLRIPMSELEPGIRRGRITFAWKQVRPWIVPSLGCQLSEYDAQPIELPLAEIAPIFMARRRDTEKKAALFTPADIPDLFTSSPLSVKAEPFRPEALKPISPVSFSPSSAQQIFPLFPDCGIRHTFVNRCSPTRSGGPYRKVRWHHRRNGQNYRVCVPPAGSLWGPALHGRRTACGRKTSSGPSADSLAAFTPQLYQRVAQYTNEIGMGPPLDLEIALQDRLLMIIKINNGYLATVSRPRESLPKAEIKAFAGGLGRRALKE